MSDPAQHKPLRWFQDDDGDTSMMRIGAMIGVGVGGATVLTGIGLAIFGTAAQVSAAPTIVAIGAGIIPTVLTTKALQRGAEAKIAGGSS